MDFLTEKSVRMRKKIVVFVGGLLCVLASFGAEKLQETPRVCPFFAHLEHRSLAKDHEGESKRNVLVCNSDAYRVTVVLPAVIDIFNKKHKTSLRCDLSVYKVWKQIKNAVPTCLVFPLSEEFVSIGYNKGLIVHLNVQTGKPFYGEPLNMVDDEEFDGRLASIWYELSDREERGYKLLLWSEARDGLSARTGSAGFVAALRRKMVN